MAGHWPVIFSMVIFSIWLNIRIFSVSSIQLDIWQVKSVIPPDTYRIQKKAGLFGWISGAS
jgi:hypothetical protein